LRIPDRSTASVVVVGAGPAGSAAARGLAQAGVETLLVDRQEFPRDKVCGDALIPDALAALEALSLRDRVLAHARRLARVRIYAPNGSHVDLDGESACLPRRRFDDILRRAAIEAGARFAAPLSIETPILVDGEVAGARFWDQAARRHVEVRADLVLLATGAAVAPLRAFGMCLRERPSAIAARRYYRVTGSAELELAFLCLSFDRSTSPGYGWLFPGPDGVVNAGVGVFDDGRGTGRPNLRDRFEQFVRSFPLARRVLRDAEPLTPLRGAPLRTAMAGSARARPGVLVLGEAAGLTYPFSGEGIGKAMESGLIAARLAAESLRSSERAADRRRAVSLAYERELEARFAARFRAYRIAQDWLASPTFANVLAWRARRGRHARAQLEGLLSETTDPRGLFSASGLVRALLC
jgi:geranylgeranyl reductase family protein